MRLAAGIDLGSTTTKAVLLDESGEVVGRGITNSRSNYRLAADIALEEARTSARFHLLARELGETDKGFLDALRQRFRHAQYLARLAELRRSADEEAASPRLAPIAGELSKRLSTIFDRMEEAPAARASGSEFFRDEAASRFSDLAGRWADRAVSFETAMGIFDKAIARVEAGGPTESFGRTLEAALASLGFEEQAFAGAASRVASAPLEPELTRGTGYGRQRLPFPRECIVSEILCHGLGAHAVFPGTRTVLDIGGQDTKAIQVDGWGIVTGFQMNDRCAAGCGRYLGYIADEMSLGVHELGPMAQRSACPVKITSTCTVFAGAELRDRLTLGQKREDILAGLHRAIILRAMALLARSGGVTEELTFTGGVAANPAAVDALAKLVWENYGERTLNISPDSIYMGALGAALFAKRALEGAESRESIRKSH